MADTPEGKVKKALKKILVARGVFFFSPTTFGFGGSGISDRVCCYKGYFIAIEVKAHPKKPTPLQVSRMREVRDAGGIAFWVNEHTVVERTNKWLDWIDGAISE